MVINTNVVGQIIKIFKALGWNLFDETQNYEDVFNKYCEMLSLLDEEEQNLIMLLTEDFLHCQHLSYLSLLKEALLNISPDKIRKAEELFLIPLANPNDLGKAKSSGAMLYSFALPTIKNIPALYEKQPIPYEKPQLLEDRHKKRQNALILILDDFIGTGDTAKLALDYYNTFRKNCDMPIVIALVAQEKGIEDIQNLGFDISVACRRKRGIRDSTRISNINQAVETMKRIEDKIGVDYGNKFGYKQSEALVSMLRTPDNTFPVFWQGKKFDGTPWPAPFEKK
jgi:hypothetical protein